MSVTWQASTRPRTGPDAALADLAAGRMVVLRDDRGPGEEGDLLIAAELVDADAVNFMAREGRGVVSLALAAERADALELSPIGSRGNSALGKASMVSIEAAEGVSTGISAADRARTIAVAADPRSRPADLRQPGHVFPLRADPRGVGSTEGRVEAAVELALGAGLEPAAVLCQILDDDGGTATGVDLEEFAIRNGLALVTVSEVVARRRALEPAPEARNIGRLMRDVMGHFASGVSVVTARDQGGAPVGTTANAISSVSLDPPLVLACLADDSETLAAIQATGRFAINILAVEQRHHSDRFARKGDAVGAHEVGLHDHDLGVPTIPGALATIACEVESIHPAGDHEIVVGLARHLEHREPGAKPLLFYRGSYSRLHVEEDELAA